MATDKYSSVIKVVGTLKDDGNWLMKSNELPGFFLCGNDLEKLYNDIPNVIKSLFKLNYQLNVDIALDRTPAQISHMKNGMHDINPTDNWIAIPAAA